MKKIHPILIALFILLKSNSFGQTAPISEDSIKTLLCHKWGIERITMSGQDISTVGETVTYEFFKDSTVTIVTENKKIKKGTWIYEPENKYVHLKIKKNADLYVKSLKEGEFLLSTNAVEDESNNALGIKTYFKIVN